MIISSHSLITNFENYEKFMKKLETPLPKTSNYCMYLILGLPMASSPIIIKADKGDIFRAKSSI